MSSKISRALEYIIGRYITRLNITIHFDFYKALYKKPKGFLTKSIKRLRKGGHFQSVTLFSQSALEYEYYKKTMYKQQRVHTPHQVFFMVATVFTIHNYDLEQHVESKHGGKNLYKEIKEDNETL